MIAPTLIFDGDCGFCTRSAEVARRVSRGRFDTTPWQEVDLPLLGLTPEQCTDAVQFVADGPDGAPEARAGHRAIAAALRTAGGPWVVPAAVLTAPGIDTLAARVYDWVAAHRYQLPGGTPACTVGGNKPAA